MRAYNSIEYMTRRLASKFILKMMTLWRRSRRISCEDVCGRVARLYFHSGQAISYTRFETEMTSFSLEIDRVMCHCIAIQKRGGKKCAPACRTATQNNSMVSKANRRVTMRAHTLFLGKICECELVFVNRAARKMSHNNNYTANRSKFVEDGSDECAVSARLHSKYHIHV